MMTQRHTLSCDEDEQDLDELIDHWNTLKDHRKLTGHLHHWNSHSLDSIRNSDYNDTKLQQSFNGRLFQRIMIMIDAKSI